MKAAQKLAQQPKQKSGQILVVMALLSTTLVIMFGMVVAIGHLVEAKINLQNSVDLAAMSGASWQARFMNNLSLINYRMRQNYKFTLYDIYVTQSRFNKGWRDAVTANSYALPKNKFDRVQNGKLIFGICMQAWGYSGGRVPNEAPSASDFTQNMCLNVSSNSGQVGGSIPDIKPSPLPNLNPFLIATNIAIAGFSNRVKQICNESRSQNKAYFEYIMGQLEKRQQHLIKQMINLLAEYGGAFSDSTDGKFAPERQADATILRTFQENLIAANSANFSTDDLEYLNPPETRAFQSGSTSIDTIESQIFSVAPITGNFGDYFERQRVFFQFPVAEFNNTGGGCQARVVARSYQGKLSSSPLGSPILIGLSRTRLGDPEGHVKIPFGIVLRARIKPNILFWPKSFTPTLVAIGSAKPFGSRLGPPAFQTTKETTGIDVSPAAGESQPQGEANMSFYPGDYNDRSDHDKAGLGHKTVLKFLLRSLPDQRGMVENRPSIMTPTGFDCDPQPGKQLNFMCYALSPTLYEGFFWNTYPFPSSANFNEEYRQAFAFDPIKGLVDPVGQDSDAQNAYVLQDRMDPRRTYSKDELAHWHYTTVIGATDYLRDANQPVFFADLNSMYSSWSPNYRGSHQVDPTAGSINTKPTAEGRMGYQIKLSTVDGFCQDIRDGQTVQVDSSPLKSYCSGGDANVFY